MAEEVFFEQDDWCAGATVVSLDTDNVLLERDGVRRRYFLARDWVDKADVAAHTLAKALGKLPPSYRPTFGELGAEVEELAEAAVKQLADFKREHWRCLNEIERLQSELGFKK